MGEKTRYFLRYFLAFLFLTAATSKLIDPYPSGDFLNSLRILPSNLIIPVVYFASGVELILSLFLIFNYKSNFVVFLFFIGMAISVI